MPDIVCRRCRANKKTRCWYAWLPYWKQYRFACYLGRLNMQKSIVSFHRKVSIRGWRFYEDCRFPFSKIPLGTVWFLAKTVLFFPRHVLLQLITDLDESSQNRCKDMFSLIGNGQSVIDRCIAVLTLSQRHTAICK